VNPGSSVNSHVRSSVYRIMKTFRRTVVPAIAAALLLVTAASAQAQRPREGDLKAGDAAPDFTVRDLTGQTTVTLSALKGKPVVLIFGSCT
jgi:cytochrome oxidase Cu insertion factor (SCO1/SenC/PrrC family)